MEKTFNYILGRKRHRIKFARQEPDHYMCGHCSVVFKKDDLEFDCHHGKSLGKHRYKPDVIECPFCYKPFEVESATRIEYEPFKKLQTKEVYAQLYQVRLEFRMQQADLKMNAQTENEGKARAYVIKCMMEQTAFDRLVIEHFPRTKVQDCLTQTIAIKPQVDWVWFDDWVATHGLPCPVPPSFYLLREGG